MSSRILVMTFAAALAAVVGCSHDKDTDHHNGSTTMHSNAAMMDACPHCPGVQTATADGKCPECGRQVVNK